MQALHNLSYSSMLALHDLSHSSMQALHDLSLWREHEVARVTSIRVRIGVGSGLGIGGASARWPELLQGVSQQKTGFYDYRRGKP